MYYYVAYGLRITSELELAELTPAESGTDLVVRLERPDECATYSDAPLAATLDMARAARLGAWLVQHPEQRNALELGREQATMIFRDIARFHVLGGREIVVAPEPGTDERALAFLIEVALLPIVLYQRERLLLHASAVLLEAGAAIFVGASGQGKSSMAAALYRSGWPIVTDDVAAIAVGDTGAQILPGFPQMKLFDHTAAALGFGSGALHIIHSDEEKCGLRATGAFSIQPQPLLTVYVLEDGKALEPEIVPIEPREVFQELIRHSYVYPQAQDASGFHQIMHMVRVVPVFRLRRRRILAELPAVARLVEAHVARLGRNSSRTAADVVVMR